MNFEETTAQKKIRKLVREFAEKEVKTVAAELDEKAEFSVHLTKRLGELGLFGMHIPQKYGGQGLDTTSYIIAVEELARIDSSQAATLASHNSLGIGPIYYHGTEEQKEKYLPKLCSGDHVWAFALTETNAGSDSRGTETTAELNKDKWVINGSKKFITNGSAENSLGATIQTVSGTKDGKKVFTNFLIDANTPGYTKSPIIEKMMWRAANTSELFFDNCELDPNQMLGNIGDGSRMMLSTLDNGRLSIAAIGLGLAQGAYEMAMEYSKKREQFGRNIGKFQSIAFKLADMATKIELARTLLYKACWLKDNDKPFGKEAAMSKLYCSEVAKEVADESLQIHGAYGLMKNHPIERFYRDQRILQIGEGTSEILRLVISRHIGI